MSKIYATCPPVGTIVRIITMAQMNLSVDDPLRLPGGLFGEIVVCGGEAGDALSTRRLDTVGRLVVLTMPQSLPKWPNYSLWAWDNHFPFGTRPNDGDYMRLRQTSARQRHAVRALVALSDERPVIVEDGWLCKGEG